MFVDLVMQQYKGHIFFAKAGVPIDNLVKKSIIKLKTLEKYYDKPIDAFELIKYICADSNSLIKVNKATEKEANKLLALEYFICLQPQPKYMLYILKRLVVAWYADIQLIKNIVKVRLLINQYRARRDQIDNEFLGVLPSILIYIRYGVTNFSEVLSKINYYFTNQIHTGWQGNEPDYFTKYNDLIYYTNGSPDIKKSFEHLPDIEKVNIYKPYTINPTAFLKYGEDVVSPFAQPYGQYDKLKYRSVFNLLDEANEKNIIVPQVEKDRIKAEQALIVSKQ